VIAAACAFVLIALCIQIRIGRQVWGSDIASPDPPAHYTTGVMAYEYIRTALFANPMEFAQSFYLRFPKVAMGHWPPVYYALQAAAYLAGGPSIATAMVLSAAICAVIAGVLFMRVRRIHGAAAGALCAACFLVLPPVQASSWLVMSDLLVGLLMFLAAVSFADFLESDTARDAAWFVTWSTLAILTKGSGWALGPFMLLAPLMAKRLSCYRSKWFWISGIAIVLLAAPFYLLAEGLQVGYPSDAEKLLRGAAAIMSRLGMLQRFWGFLPVLVLVVAAAGVIARWRERSTAETAALALVASQVAFLLVLPLTFEGRYFMPSAIAVMLLFARGMTLGGRSYGPLAIAGACFAVCGIVDVGRVDGYRAVVDSIPYRPQGSVILVSSDSPGEGAFVAGRLEHDRDRAGVVLRGSKVLGDSNWNGNDYRLRFGSAVEVGEYLRSVPVHYVVIDESATREPHHELLKEAVSSAPEEFRLTGRFAISGRRHGEVLVYENLPARARAANVLFKTGARTVRHRVE